MQLTVRQTTQADLTAAAHCLECGKKALAQRGIPQWQGAYPNEEDIARDMEAGASYVATNEAGEVLGVMALSLDGESTYDAIAGKWLTNSHSSSPTYAVIHRCAVSTEAAHQGVMTAMFKAAEDIARKHESISMRIDTHKKNLPLQGLAKKLGYTLCGEITLPNQDELDPKRLAFEKSL